MLRKRTGAYFLEFSPLKKEVADSRATYREKVKFELPVFKNSAAAYLLRATALEQNLELPISIEELGKNLIIDEYILCPFLCKIYFHNCFCRVEVVGVAQRSVVCPVVAFAVFFFAAFTLVPSCADAASIEALAFVFADLVVAGFAAAYEAEQEEAA